MRTILGVAVTALAVLLSTLPIAAQSTPHSPANQGTRTITPTPRPARRGDAPLAHGTRLEAGQALSPTLVVRTTRPVYLPYQKITVRWSGYPADSLGEIWVEPASVPRSTVTPENYNFIHGIRGTTTFAGLATPGEYAVRVTVGTSTGTVLLYEYDFTVRSAAAHTSVKLGKAAHPKVGRQGKAPRAHGTLLEPGQALSPTLVVRTTRPVYLPYQKITVRWSGYPADSLGEIWVEPASVPRSTLTPENYNFIHGIRGTTTFAGLATPGEYAVRVTVGTSTGTVLLYEYDFHVGTVPRTHRSSRR